MSKDALHFPNAANHLFEKGGKSMWYALWNPLMLKDRQSKSVSSAILTLIHPIKKNELNENV